MILSETELTMLAERLKVDAEIIRPEIAGIEDFIRQYTNNSFNIRSMRCIKPSLNGKLESVSPMFRVGDTVEISKTDINDGIYVLKSLDGELDKELYDYDFNMITLVKYPDAIKHGVCKMIEYSVKTADKVGIASESLSRHSVSYYHNSNNSAYDFPESYLAFLKPYMKARF